jgi:ADP-ribose pyrophosphatase
MTGRPIFQRTPKPWKTTSTKRVASLGKVELHLDRLVSKTGFRMNHPRLVLHDFSIVVPVANRNRLVFVWNYRPPIKGWELELPAGLVDNGENPQHCAVRELAEETGYSAMSWKKLGWLHVTPGISAQRAHVYLARGLKRGTVHREPYEQMETRIITVRKAYQMVRAGNFIHSPTISALGLAESSLSSRSSTR